MDHRREEYQPTRPTLATMPGCDGKGAWTTLAPGPEVRVCGSVDRSGGSRLGPVDSQFVLDGEDAGNTIGGNGCAIFIPFIGDRTD